MKISEVMTPDVKIASPSASLRDAARMMAEIDCGVLPVGDKDRLVGVITDRDIAIRGLGHGLKPTAKVREVMSRDVKYCFDDEDVDHIVLNMAEIQVRRLPVVNRGKRLVGIVSLGDIAVTEGPDVAGQAICGISETRSVSPAAQMTG
jgi:CBS domain-containing protein